MWTDLDSQSSIKINVYRGEGAMVRMAHPLGIYEIIDIPFMPAGQPQILVSFKITRMHDIYIKAKIESNGEKLNIRKYLVK